MKPRRCALAFLLSAVSLPTYAGTITPAPAWRWAVPMYAGQVNPEALQLLDRALQLAGEADLPDNQRLDAYAKLARDYASLGRTDRVEQCLNAMDERRVYEFSHELAQGTVAANLPAQAALRILLREDTPLMRLGLLVQYATTYRDDPQRFAALDAALDAAERVAVHHNNHSYLQPVLHMSQMIARSGRPDQLERCLALPPFVSANGAAAHRISLALNAAQAGQLEIAGALVEQAIEKIEQIEPETIQEEHRIRLIDILFRIDRDEQALHQINAAGERNDGVPTPESIAQAIRIAEACTHHGHDDLARTVIQHCLDQVRQLDEADQREELFLYFHPRAFTLMDPAIAQAVVDATPPGPAHTAAVYNQMVLHIYRGELEPARAAYQRVQQTLDQAQPKPRLHHQIKHPLTRAVEPWLAFLQEHGGPGAGYDPDQLRNELMTRIEREGVDVALAELNSQDLPASTRARLLVQILNHQQLALSDQQAIRLFEQLYTDLNVAQFPEPYPPIHPQVPPWARGPDGVAPMLVPTPNPRPSVGINPAMMVGLAGTQPQQDLTESETVQKSWLQTAMKTQAKRWLAEQIIPMTQAIENPATLGLALTSFYKFISLDPALRSEVFDRAAELAKQAKKPANRHAILYLLDLTRYPSETDRGALREQVFQSRLRGLGQPPTPQAFQEAAGQAYLAALTDDRAAFRQAMAHADVQVGQIPEDSIHHHAAVFTLARLANAFPALAEDPVARAERALAVAVATNTNAQIHAGQARRSMGWPQPGNVLAQVLTFYPMQEASPMAHDRLATLTQAAAEEAFRDDHTQWRLARATQLGLAWNALGRHDQTRQEVEDAVRTTVTNPDLSEYYKAWPGLYDVYHQANGNPATILAILNDPDLRIINRSNRMVWLIQSISSHDPPAALRLIDQVEAPVQRIELLRQMAIP